MKVFFLLITLLILVTHAQSQLNLPLFSEPAHITQRVGNTTFQLSYERPKRNGRIIYGNLVPYDQVWRTGAGPCTKIRFDEPVYIDLKKIEAGLYSLFSIPAKDSWTFILNKDTTLYGSYDYNPDLDVIRKEVPIEYSHKHFEAMSLQFDVVNDIARLNFNWLNVQASLNIRTETYATLQKQIENIIKNDYELESGTYANAADYLIHNKEGFGPEYLDLAYQLIEVAFQREELSSFTYHMKTKILELLENKEEFMKVSEQHIKFLQDEKPYDGYESDIKEIKLKIKNYKD